MTRILSIFLLVVVFCFSANAQQVSIIKEIAVRGNKEISREAILAAMRSKEQAPFVQADLARDEQAVRELGFFRDVKILSRAISDVEWQLIVEVEENPVVREIRISGNSVVKAEQIEKIVLANQAVGQVYNLRSAGPIASAIRELYQKGGYDAQADIAPATESPQTLSITIYEQTVNRIIVNGLVRTRESVVRRLLKTKPGQAFNQNTWGIDQRRLISTQWFQDIVPKAQETNEIGKFDLIMDVKEAQTGMLNFGLALDSKSRIAGTFRASDSNFRGSGQTVSVSLQQDTFGGGSSISLDWLNPFYDDRDTSVAARLYSRVNSYFSGNGFGNSDSPTDDRFDERRTGFSIAVSRPFRKELVSTIGITGETVRSINLRNTGQFNYIQQDGEQFILNLGLARDRRDVPLDPAEGDYIRIGLEPGFAHITKVGGDVATDTSILGQNTFFRTSLEYKAFFSKRPAKNKPADEPRQVLAVRAKLGSIGGRVPFFEQFFVGGSDSLRGYADQRFWGKNQFVTTVEYRVPFQKTFSIAAFADYGGAWGGYRGINKFDQSSSINLKLGYGLGIAFRTPLGPIRIDFGFNQEGGSRTHFSIGSSF